MIAREGYLGCSLNTGGGFGEFGDRIWDKESTLGLQKGTQSHLFHMNLQQQEAA